jgi:acetyltransferase-like isoleucine patch superfamily enzyme
MNLLDILKQVQLMFLKKASDEKKIKYLRKQGMKIGEGCTINSMSFSTEPYLIEIGDHVAIAAGTDFITHDGGIWSFREELGPADIFGQIKIGNNVFFGNSCIILPNTIIGDNCIVGAGSVVRGKFPENSVIIGNPAKVVLKTNVQRFLYLQNPNLLKTQNLSSSEKKKILQKHFGTIQRNPQG